MLLCVLIFGLMDALVKLAAERHPIGQIIFFRNLFAFIPLSFFIHRAGGLSVLRTRYATQHLLRSITGITSMALTFYAFARMPLADAVAIGLSAPIFLTTFSVPLLGEHVGWRRWSAVGVGFIGILIITRPGSGVFGAIALIPLASAALYAVAMIQIRKVATREPAGDHGLLHDPLRHDSGCCQPALAMGHAHAAHAALPDLHRNSGRARPDGADPGLSPGARSP